MTRLALMACLFKCITRALLVGQDSLQPKTRFVKMKNKVNEVKIYEAEVDRQRQNT